MKPHPLVLATCLLVPAAALSDGVHASAHDTAVTSPQDTAIPAPFDILAAHVHLDGRIATFHMTTAATAGSAQPDPVGDLAGAPVHAYVWPTTLDPSAVGFEAETGILALAATSHPDFDDTPLFDENGDGDLANDGLAWHSHWVVLVANDECGPGALSVRDIGADETPALPRTWPGLPLFIDSPGYTPVFDGEEVVVRVPFDAPADISAAGYDGVTAALRVHANLHAPLLCVSDVFDIASGALTLPGRVE